MESASGERSCVHHRTETYHLEMVSTTEARAGLPDLLDRVERGEEITITRHGRPVAVLVRPDRLAFRRGERALSAATEIQRRLADARNRSASDDGGSLSPDRADQLVADVRAARDARRRAAGR